MSELRRAVGGVLLGVGTVAVSGVLVLGFAVVSWSARSGFLPPLRALMLTSVLALSVGLVLWGRDRWRSVFGAIGITVGLVGASVAATVPVATRSAEWVARGGPAPDDLHAGLLFVLSAALALGGWGLRGAEPEPRPVLGGRLEQTGPARIRQRSEDGGRTYRPD